MQRPKTLAAFSLDEYQKAHYLLATTVALMMGRKLEEDDWARVYSEAKNIPYQGWSNLSIDFHHNGLGVEQKMLKVRSNIALKSLCGQRIMHPSMTRSIRVPPVSMDPQEAMIDILGQYTRLVAQRTQAVSEESPQVEPDMRIGWLIWQESLEEFLYFEEEMLQPNPDDYRAEWHETQTRKTRKSSVNLWIFEKETGHKRYSITTEAGAKIQPYFDVPPPNDPHVYFFRVQGEPIGNQQVRIWVTASTHRELVQLIGKPTVEEVSRVILETAQQVKSSLSEPPTKHAPAVSLTVTTEAYAVLKTVFEGVSDEHLMQLLVRHLLNLKA